MGASLSSLEEQVRVKVEPGHRPMINCQWGGTKSFSTITTLLSVREFLLQASVSRMPRGGDGGELEEPCITCIRIELGEAVRPDGE